MIPRLTLLSLTGREQAGGGSRLPWPVDVNYWLAHCEGFVVRGSHGAVGVVDHVVFGSRLDRPDVVAVRRAWPRGVRMVPVADVVEVDPRDGCLVVGGGHEVRAARVGVAGGLRRLVHPHHASQATGPFGRVR